MWRPFLEQTSGLYVHTKTVIILYHLVEKKFNSFWINRKYATDSGTHSTVLTVMNSGNVLHMGQKL